MACCGRKAKRKKAKMSAAAAEATGQACAGGACKADAPAPPPPPPKPTPSVSIERWCGRGWWGVPDPVRRHVARSLGLAKKPAMPGCGCLVRWTGLVEDWEECGGVRGHAAAAIAWLAPRASAALSLVLTLWLMARPPGEPLRRLLATAMTAAVGKVGPATVIRIDADMASRIPMTELVAHAVKTRRRVGDVLTEAINAAHAAATQKTGAAGGD